MNLIIVESPTKAKTISRFLSGKYKVESSLGHIRDLPKTVLGVDVDNSFEPKYVIPPKARKTISTLKALAKQADRVILASDEDREGEAIAWHLQQVLSLSDNSYERIVFHEITKDAITNALANPRQINLAMVDSQQARRILDRLVGYKLSPFLWKKVAKGLSAGRVQSVAIRLIVEREREIQVFVSESYWSLDTLLKGKALDELKAKLVKINDKTIGRLDIKENQAKELESKLKQSKYSVAKVTKKQVKKSPPLPFTTASLQQTANRNLGFSAKQTMTLAQKLYEKGYITYMRTDSYNLSSKFRESSNLWLKNNLGEKYLSTTKRIIKNKGAQEAHEAIRPTEIESTPEQMEKKLESGEARLYKLIWQRALSSLMSPAIINATTIDINANTKEQAYTLRANGQIIDFDGYLKIWPEKTSQEVLPELKTEDNLELIKVVKEEHETMPPARYSDAGLVQVLEKHSIGRPSTYAPTINTIMLRNYVKRDEGKRLKPTDIAFIVNDLLVSHFPKIVDYKFTAQMEGDLDQIAHGEKKWQTIIADFYQDLIQVLEKKDKELSKDDIMPTEKSNEVCEKCGSEMIIKTGRYGKYLACSGFPECKNIKSLNKKEGGSEPSPEVKKLQEKYKDKKCEKCGSDLIVRVGKYGPFLGCSAYPKCKYLENISTTDTEPVPCPVCGVGKIVKRIGRRGPFYACDNYPQCKNIYSGEPTGKDCPKCGALMILNKSGSPVCSNRECKKNK